MDRRGRVLLPKRLRNAIDVKPGDALLAHLDGAVLKLTPIATLRKVDGFLILDLPGKPVLIGDAVAIVRAARERELLERVKKK